MSLFENIEAIYDDTWATKPYTNARAIELIMARCGKPVDELCRMSTKAWKKNSEADLLKQFDEDVEIMETLLLDGIGDCTTFTAYITQRASQLQDFTMGDTGGHRLAWASNGVLIDSSAKQLIQLQDGVLVESGKKQFLWTSSASGPGTLEVKEGEKPLRQVELLTTTKEDVDPNVLFEEIETIYNDTWATKPYTNAPAIELIITRCGKPVEELCRMSPKAWKNNFQADLLKQFDEDDEIMETAPGRYR
ncbi:hypothetical protein MMC07_001123 [Pseudocyphellaria aurata]|nr:hypothetical protein [Pseudocyphellaria aurata]